MNNKKEILQELIDISPNLLKVKEDLKGELYDVPENYFETLEINILEKTILHDATLIEDVPEHYFDELEGVIFAKIEENEPISKTIKMTAHDSKIYETFGVFAKIAAIFLISFIAIKGFYHKDSLEKVTATNVLEDQISQQDVLSYIEENLSEFEDDDLLALNNMPIETTKDDYTTPKEETKSLEINDYASPGEEVTNEDIMQYLEENIDDIALEDINSEIF